MYDNTVIQKFKNRIVGDMGSVLASSAVDPGFEPRSDQTEDIGICCFSAEHLALRKWVDRNVYPRAVVSVNQHNKNPTKRVGLVQSGPHHHLIEK